MKTWPNSLDSAPVAGERHWRRARNPKRLSADVGGNENIMNKTSLAFTLALVTCRLDAADLWPILTNRPFQAVVVPAESAKADRFLTNQFVGFWTPSVEEVAKAETRIAEFINAASTNSELEPLQRTLSIKVRDDTLLYVRQYVGISYSGRHSVFCNAIQSRYLKDTRVGDSDRWRRGYIATFDVHNNWRIEYSFAEDRCFGFRIDEGY
jgi:hypothetical protein